MVFTFADDEIRSIVNRSANLAERVAGYFQSIETHQRVIDTRLKRWQAVVAKSDQDDFVKRFQQAGLDSTMSPRFVTDVELTEGIPLPNWANFLRDIDLSPSNNRSQENEKTFAEFIVPFVTLAKGQLQKSTKHLTNVFSADLYLQLTNYLTTRLLKVASPTLEDQFHHSNQISLLSRLSAKPKLDRTSQQYMSFVETMNNGQWKSLLLDFPVLARLLAEVSVQWVESNTLFLTRLQQDWSDLEQTFSPHTPITTVVHVNIGLSDPHNKGQTVLILTFDTGLRLVYKPRPLEVEAWFYSVLMQLNASELKPEFKGCTFLLREQYGWMEHIVSKACQCREEVQHYYHRAGMLLGLLYIFNGTDVHATNLINHGSQPMLTDLETLLQPQWLAMQDFAVLVNQRATNTVLATHFLPKWEIHKDVALDGTAMGGNPVILGKRPVPLMEFVSHLKKGFQDVTFYMTQNHDQLMALQHSVFNLRHRVIFHNTELYDTLMSHSLQPQYLKSGVERSIELEKLYRPMLLHRSETAHCPRFSAEIEAIERLDIPYFMAIVGQTHLFNGERNILNDMFANNGWDHFLTNLQMITTETIETQTRLIHGTFEFYENPWVREPLEPALPLLPLPQYSTEDILSVATNVADSIWQQVIFDLEGSPYWFIPVTLHCHNKTYYQFTKSNYFLYEGTSGIALFLAALARVSGQETYSQMAYRTVQRICQNMSCSSFREDFVRNMPIGASEGIGSIIYALTRISRFLDKPEILEAAHHTVLMLTSKKMTNDPHFDVFKGTAGSILGTLVLFEATQDTSILDLARQCGSELLKKRIKTPTGHWGWPTLRNKIVAGLSHGQAGIAYALLKLYEQTQETPFLQAAEEAISCENTLFSAKQQNWRAFGSSVNEPVFWTTFCHGAPGIGLARLGGLPILDTQEIRQDIRTAIQNTKDYPLDGLDFLCCGNLGRLDFLLEANRVLPEAEHTSHIREQLTQIVQYYNHHRRFRVFQEGLPHVHNPSFFKGDAGIGYQLLRIAYPDQYPSVLLWQ